MKLINLYPTALGPTPPAKLVDNHGRVIDYLRLSITDRCNLRCRYCMPAEGIAFTPHGEILSFEELLRLVRIFAAQGVKKVRLTGGEPFVRKGVIDFIAALAAISGIEQIHLTTNGVETAAYLKTLRDLGVSGINLSLDTLRRQRFRYITRRDVLPQVIDTMCHALELGIPLKINTVMYQRVNADDILPLAELARQHPITVRFIEQMPFGGQAGPPAAITGSHIREILQQSFPSMEEIPGSGTARLYTMAGFQGRIGIIQGYSRQFCHTCNKVRVTPVGMLKTCLYDRGALDLKQLCRSGASDQDISRAVIDCLQQRAANGHAVETAQLEGRYDSMSAIGG